MNKFQRCAYQMAKDDNKKSIWKNSKKREVKNAYLKIMLMLKLDHKRALELKNFNKSLIF